MVITCQIVCLLLAVALLVWGQEFSWRKLASGFVLGLGSNLVVTLYYMHQKQAIWYGKLADHSAFSPIRYLLYTGSLILLGAALFGFISGRFRLEKTSRPWRLLDYIPVFIVLVMSTLAAGLYLASDWAAKLTDTLTAEQLTFMFANGSGETTVETDAQLLNQVYLPTLVIALVATLFAVLARATLVIQKRQHSVKKTRFLLPVLAVVTSFCAVAVSIDHAFGVLPLSEVFNRKSSTFLADHYVDPKQVALKFPAKKRNLIHIYMESVENSYYSKAEGGYLPQSLMPDLAQLTKENVSFSSSTKFGGPEQTYGSGHSIAAMINFQAGVPLFGPTRITGKELIYPDFPNLGDILHQQGYQNEIMLGANANWGDLGSYYRDHGKFKVFDLLYARKTGLVAKNYKVRWGVEDDKLYEYAKTEMNQLAQSNQPFYLIVENADTHFPDGYVSPRMTKKPFSSQYANVIHYSQKQTVDLVRWIQQQPFYKNTTIVVTGDHRSMDAKFFKGWDKHYDRQIVNIFINGTPPTPPQSVTSNRVYAPFDFFPTLLASIGVEIPGQKLGLGTNLYSGQKTLLESGPVEKVKSQLSDRSSFYEKHRLKY